MRRDGRNRIPFFRRFLATAAFPAVLLLLSLSLCACGVNIPFDATTAVVPLPQEDLTGLCEYGIVLAKSAGRPVTQKGVFVIYQRGDSSVLLEDPQVRAMAANLGFAIIFANQCNAASYGDIQSNPFKGPGRALLQALVQFAQETGHAELSSANLALYGFSAAGVLAAEMASYAPSRIIGLIAYAPGSAYQDISAYQPVVQAYQVPSLFLANGDDVDSGTQRSLTYFVNGRDQGALWAYAVQPGVGHCCNITTRPMILSWLPAVVSARGGPGTLRSLAEASGISASFVCTPDGPTDAQGDKDCSFTAATITGSALPSGQSAWLPDRAAAQAWLSWVNSSAN